MELKTILEIIVVAILVLEVVIYIYWQIKKKGLKEFAIDTILAAEDIYEKGENEAKINYVIDRVIAVLPVPLQFFITRNTVRKFIQFTFDGLKKALDYESKKGEK